MQHLAQQWRSAAATSGVRLLLLDHTDPEQAAEAIKVCAEHGHTAAVEPTAWGRDVMHALTVDKGFSFHDHVGDAPTSGYMVSVNKATERVIPARDITGADIADYADVHQQELAEPDNYLGAWVYRGMVYLDVSQHFADREQALAAARAHSQIGIYDIGAGETIVTATGQAAASLTDRRPALAVLTTQSHDAFAAQLRALAGEPPG